MQVTEDISVPWNKTIVIVGARNQGKSNLAQFLVLNPESEGNRGLGCQCDVILVFGNGASYLQSRMAFSQNTLGFQLFRPGPDQGFGKTQELLKVRPRTHL